MSSEKKSKKRFSRRKFMVRSAIGLGVIIGGVYLGRHSIRRYLATTIDEIDLPYDNSFPPNMWFEATADNQIIFHCPKVEMGQGSFTGLAQIAADELDVDINQLQVVHASTAGGPIDPFSTGGSTSISGLWQPLRELAATMREMLKNEAAQLMNVSPESLSVKDGVISGGGQSMTYGEVVKTVKEWTVPDTPKLKDLSAYQYIGKPVPRIDLEAKVLGEPLFGIDAEMPDMLYASVARPSQIAATFVGAKTEKAAQMPGVVKVVLEKDFVAVVAQSRTEANNAKKMLEVEWKVDKVWQQEDIEEMIKVGKGTPFVIQKQGKAKRILHNEEDVITAEFFSPIGAHAQLEPNGALAHVEGDKATIIISTQVVDITRKEVAKRLGIDKERVEIQPTFLGGGFGRRLHTPNAVQAAVISKAVGKPVHCFFDRKEEFQNDTFRPPTHHVLKAKLDEKGMIKALEHNVSSGDVAFGSPMLPDVISTIAGADFGAWRGGMIQYRKIPNFRAISWRVKLPFATSFWRSLGLLANTFAIECFMDELAHQTGKDPVQFRLDQIADDERGQRLRKVIEAAAEKGNWGKPVAKGRAQGFAASTDANTPVAQVVEVSIENGKIKVHKVTCVIDPGMAVNPDQVRAQCEGCIIMGLSAAMYEKMEVKDGSLGAVNYGTYPMALMKHAPKDIEVVILENADKPGAVGEPPLGPIGAAIANAAFQLTGKRLRSLPLEPA